MRFSTLFAAALPFFGVALAEVHTIKVGENGTLTFNPSNITAQNGDMIQFQFLSKNHTVTQSTFASPCQNMSGASIIDSGFQNIPAGSTTFMQYSFNMTNVTAPLWFYCRQATHCQKGMVFSVNATPEKSFDMFKAAAMATDPTTGAPATNSSSTNGSSSASPSSSSGAPSASTSANANDNGAMGVKAGSALLLSGLGLVATLVL